LMKVMTMLDLDAVDLDELAMALEDNSWESSWWIDPSTGELEICSPDDEVDSFQGRGLIPIEAIGSREAYTDMSTFVDRVRAQRPRELLERAIQGRGAFRRFKDTLFEFPELREEWFTFHDRRMPRRAVEWLAEEGLVDPAAADAALAGLDDDVGVVGPEDVASEAADALRELYGGRLSEVVLFGSYARGEAGQESDIDLLVVLHGPVSPWDELRRLDDLLWQLSLDRGITVSVLPVSDEQWRTGQAPVLIEARAHGAVVS
jgi:predicted nucleotidyltransferase